MFLNTSWSEWLKSPLSSITNRADEERTLPSTELDVSSTSSNRSKSFKELYPEEGTVDLTSCQEEANLSSSNTPGTSTDNRFSSSHKDISSFKRGLPFISSSPFSQSPFLKKASEDFGSESLMTESSTSKFLKEDRCTRTLLPTARKRLRDHSEEEKCDDGNVCSKTESKGIKLAHAPVQLFSEGEMEANSEMTRMVKRPRFSISAFGSPLQTHHHHHPNTPQEEESFQPVSFFYPGRIAFGGASNHHRRKLKIVPRKIVPHVATPAPTCDGGLDEGLSSVARRILHCIDKISTPLSVSKRALPFTAARDGSSFVAHFHKYRPTLKSEVTTPPTNKLLIPAKVKVRKNISSLIEPETVPSSTNNTCNWSVQNSYSRADIPVQSVCKKTLLPSVSPDIIKEKAIAEPCKVPPSLLKVEKFGDPKDKVLQPSGDLPLSRSSLISNDHKKESEKDKNYTALLNPVAESIRSFSKDESEQYKFCEPEIIFSVPCQDSLIPTAAFDQTEFEFSLPLETVHMPLNSVDVSHNDCEKNIEFSKGTLENDILTSQISKESSCLPSGSWGEAFKLPKGSWECQSCLLQNKEETSSCIACMTPKPSENKSCSTPVSQETKQHSSSWGDAFKPPSGMWECQVCLVQNKDNSTKCAACETPKSSTKEQFTFTSLLTTKDPSFTSAASMEVWQKKGFTDSWGDAFKPAKGSWECSSCLVQNAERDTMCVSCMSPKPTDSNSGKALSKKESDSFQQGLFGNNSLVQPQDNFKSNNNTSLVCSKCIPTNLNSEKNCTRCKNPSPDIAINSTNSNKNQTITGLKTLTSGMPKSDSWCCETCFAWNKVAIQKCTSCGSPKFSLTPVSVSEAFTGNFQFGVKTQTFQQVKEAPSSTFNKPSSSTSSSSAAHTTPLSLPNQVFFPPSQSSTDEVKMPLNESKSQSDSAEKKNVSQSQQSKFSWNTNFSVASTGSSSSLFGNTMSFSSLKPHANNEVPEKDPTQTPKPSFKFSVATPASFPNNEVSTTQASTKTEFPKPEIKNSATMGFSFTPKEVSKPATEINSSSKTFNFFQNTDKPFTFNSPSIFGTTTTASKDTLGTITSATSTVPIVSSSPQTSFAFAPPPPSSSSGIFAFGQNNSKPLSTGFNFGEAGAKQPPTAFTFGSNSTNKIFQFGQNSAPSFNPPKLAQPEAPPSLVSIDMQKNPFTATPAAGGPQRRIIKRAYRRNK